MTTMLAAIALLAVGVAMLGAYAHSFQISGLHRKSLRYIRS